MSSNVTAISNQRRDNYKSLSEFIAYAWKNVQDANVEDLHYKIVASIKSTDLTMIKSSKLSSLNEFFNLKYLLKVEYTNLNFQLFHVLEEEIWITRIPNDLIFNMGEQKELYKVEFEFQKITSEKYYQELNGLLKTMFFTPNVLLSIVTKYLI